MRNSPVRAALAIGSIAAALAVAEPSVAADTYTETFQDKVCVNPEYCYHVQLVVHTTSSSSGSMTYVMQYQIDGSVTDMSGNTLDFASRQRSVDVLATRNQVSRYAITSEFRDTYLGTDCTYSTTFLFVNGASRVERSTVECEPIPN